jgi:large subunit ribosomal protein L21
MAEIREIKKESKKDAPKAPKAKGISKTVPTPRVGTKAPMSRAFAIIETGGKQYRVAVGDFIKVEKILNKTENGTIDNIKEGDTVVFDKVLLIDNGVDATDIGTPYITGAKVSGTLVEIGRNAKVIVLKYKQKSRYFKKNGHRQPYFKVKIEKIS